MHLILGRNGFGGGTGGTGLEPKFKSTCHLALASCEKSASCSRYLEQVKRTCDRHATSCDKQKCMRAIQEMYREIPYEHTLEIAFCLCR